MTTCSGSNNGSCRSNSQKNMPRIPHPLDPLTPSEVAAAVAMIKQEKSAKYRFGSVTLLEPPKEQVLLYNQHHHPATTNSQQQQQQHGELNTTSSSSIVLPSIPRQAFIILLDNATGECFEAVVTVPTTRTTTTTTTTTTTPCTPTLDSWTLIPNVQPAFMLDEFVECENAVKADPAFQAAIAKRGITDVSLVMVDPWSAGHYGLPEDTCSSPPRRMSRALCWVKASATDNGYARPIEGVIPVVDLNQMKVLWVEDHCPDDNDDDDDDKKKKKMIPLPPNDGNYTKEHQKAGYYRNDIQPLEITQPLGPSFTITDGTHVAWQKWKVRVGFTPREGVVLYTCSYTDRPIFYRASLVEMTVPYGSPLPHHYRKNAFDVGEYNLGSLANSLTLGCDCKGYIHYMDATMVNSAGDVVVIENAVCIHEEDYGILWKHMDWRTEHTEVRRSRRLVISFIATVGNYEYGYYWYFYQDGTVEYEIKLTGIVNTVAVLPGTQNPKYGSLIAPQLMAPIHQHVFCVRMDMCVDGPDNAVYEVDIVPEEDDELNPYGNAFYAKQTLLETEQEAQRMTDPLASRFWKIASKSQINAMGYPTAFKLLPGENSRTMARPTSSVMGRAHYMSKQLWVTPYRADEIYPTGKYPNQSPGGKGLPEWTSANRSLVKDGDDDLVVWYTFAHTHAPRAEDWPVMPVGTIGFMLKPYNFFGLNPSNDVPAESEINQKVNAAAGAGTTTGGQCSSSSSSKVASEEAVDTKGEEKKESV